MDYIYFRKLICIGILLICSGCKESSESKNNLSEQHAVDQNQTEDVLAVGEPLELEFNLEPIIVVVEAPETIVFSDSGEIWLNGAPLSTAYPEYFSGFWRGYLCGGTGFARIGINGTSLELNTGSGIIDPTFGSVTSSGELLLPSRDVNWDADCETCGEVRPLLTTGMINWDLDSGLLNFEVACSNGDGHTVSSIYVDLKKGKNQPAPYNELPRIRNDAITLIGDSPTCSENKHCKLLNLKSDDFCGTWALVYSILDTDAELIESIQDEYRMNERLAYGNSGSSLTLCGQVKKASCEQNICI